MNPTGGDISPDGSKIIVKNEPFMLIWNREEGESVADAMARRPKQVKAYKKESQGEAIAWLDSTTFYTTSDSDVNEPIYMYTKKIDDAVENVVVDKDNETVKILDTNSNMVYIRKDEKVYTLTGSTIE